MYEYIFAQIRSEAEKRNLKDSTIDAYCNTIGYFLRTVNKDINALSTDDVDVFLTEKRLRGLAPQTYNHYHSSIRFFYKRILKMNWDDEDIPRMKLDRSLPTVLSREEMQRIIDVTSNLKHKAIIATMYSSGLRVSSEMNFHPHIHAVVLGGGLDSGNHWKDNGEEFFLPIRVVSRLFRGKYLAELKQLWEDGKLEFHGSSERFKNHYTYKELLDSCYGKEWVPYCKKPFDGAESVIRYLGKYTHRIAISNYRIKALTDNSVTFTAKDYKNHGHWKEVTISGEEFLIKRYIFQKKYVILLAEAF